MPLQQLDVPFKEMTEQVYRLLEPPTADCTAGFSVR
jgi:hypothetical protein